MRALTIQAILRILNNNSSEIQTLLSMPSVSNQIEITEPGSFQSIRLLPNDGSKRNDLCLKLINDLFKNPLYEFQWLQELQKKDMNQIKKAMLEDGDSLENVLNNFSDNFIDSIKMDQVLMVRGFLAHRLFSFIRYNTISNKNGQISVAFAKSGFKINWIFRN